MLHSQKAGVLMVMTSGLLFGFGGACSQYLFEQQGVDYHWLVPIRLLTAGLILLLFSRRTQGGLLAPLRSWRSALQLVAYGVFGVMLMQYGYLAAIHYSNVGTATVLQNTAPAMLVIVACILERKLPRAKEIISILLALVGVWLLATHGQAGQLILSPQALGIGLLSALAVVLNNLIPKKLMERYPVTVLVGWGMLIGGLVMTAAFKPHIYPVTYSMPLVAATAGLIVLGTVLSFLLYMLGLRIVGPTRASLLVMTEPISAALLAAMWFGAKFFAADLLGFGCILAVMVLLAPMKQKTP